MVTHLYQILDAEPFVMWYMH